MGLEKWSTYNSDKRCHSASWLIRKLCDDAEFDSKQGDLQLQSSSYSLYIFTQHHVQREGEVCPLGFQCEVFVTSLCKYFTLSNSILSQGTEITVSLTLESSERTETQPMLLPADIISRFCYILRHILFIHYCLNRNTSCVFLGSFRIKWMITAYKLDEALRYKSEGRGFDYQWGLWIVHWLNNSGPHYGSGVESASNRYLLRGKGDWCTGLKPHYLLCWLFRNSTTLNLLEY
jgi:hypothetical protein